ncbi:phage portal protein [Dethiosulfovibrio sp. F2B]|uniref:phage portal protein n=1 Tax=Dethiosulfovibrio faecalis TaxID=2720018 RepID=UPI001F337211|nr:phage portal protein [Dethiosulfovibrio faecalis]MCF4152609.1 phage portal protein [Dethiosulfovibrio faecalis]
MKFLKNLFRRKSDSYASALQMFYPGGESSSGVHVNANTAMQSSAVYSCVGLISESVATLPLKIYRRRNDGGRDEARDHPLWSVFNSCPNDWMTAFELREYLLQHLALRGNAYCYKVRDGSGRVRELLPIHPGMVSVKQERDWSLVYSVTFLDGSVRRLGSDDIWHLRYRTLDGYTGVSPIAYHRDTIGLAITATKHGGRLIKNGARPSGVLSIEGRLDKEQIERLRESWQALYSGENAGKVAVLEENAKFQPVSLSQEDLQYLQTRQFQVEDIARIFRVPLHMIQSTTKTTSWGSGIESMSIGFVTYTLMPWLRRMESSINRDFGLAKDMYAEFAVNGLLRGDIKARYQAYQIAIQSGFMSPNEVRSLENLNPREGGDEYLTPMNMSSTGKDDDDDGDEKRPLRAEGD